LEASQGPRNTVDFVEDVEDERKMRKCRMVDENEPDTIFLPQYWVPLLKVPFHVKIF
jgi:hypothetical protein